MTGTKFSIDLQGIELTSDVARSLESQMRGVVFAELAKLDLGQGLRVAPLPSEANRLLPILPILGFIIEKIGQLATLPTSVEAQRLSSPEAAQAAVTQLGTGQPFDLLHGEPLSEVVEALALRPDLRAASLAISRSLTQMTSSDPEIVKTFERLIDAPISAPAPGEFAPVAVVAYLAVCGLLAGVGLGLMSRPHAHPPQ